MEERPNQRQSRQAQQSQDDLRQPQQSQGGVSGLGDSSQSRSMGQQGAGSQSAGSQSAGRQSASGQQTGARLGQEHQFDMARGQQSGGSGTEGRFADRIREHMEVIDDRGQHCGTVDHVEGDRIKLARSDSRDGQHHYVSMSQVAGIEGDKVRLRERGDNDFGMESGR